MTKSEYSQIVNLLSKIIKEQGDEIELNEYIITDLRNRLTEAEETKHEIT